MSISGPSKSPPAGDSPASPASSRAAAEVAPAAAQAARSAGFDAVDWPSSLRVWPRFGVVPAAAQWATASEVARITALPIPMAENVAEYAAEPRQLGEVRQTLPSLESEEFQPRIVGLLQDALEGLDRNWPVIAKSLREGDLQEIRSLLDLTGERARQAAHHFSRGDPRIALEALRATVHSLEWFCRAFRGQQRGLGDVLHPLTSCVYLIGKWIEMAQSVVADEHLDRDWRMSVRALTAAESISLPAESKSPDDERRCDIDGQGCRVTHADEYIILRAEEAGPIARLDFLARRFPGGPVRKLEADDGGRHRYAIASAVGNVVLADLSALRKRAPEGEVPPLALLDALPSGPGATPAVARIAGVPCTMLRVEGRVEIDAGRVIPELAAMLAPGGVESRYDRGPGAYSVPASRYEALVAPLLDQARAARV